VSLRDSQLGELKVPLTWTAAVALVVVAVVAIALLLSDRRETFQAQAYGATRSMSDRMLAPVGNVLSTPGRWTGAGVDTVRGYFFAVSENRRLKRELQDMRQWRDVAIALRDTNERYQTLLGLKTDPPIPMVAARIVSDSRGPFANTRLANTGREGGVMPGNPVMSENGLVGRVIGVTNGASRVLMLTDVASRTPVMIDRTNARAILTGDGGPNPRLDYLRGREPVKEGDRILTSGDGGVIPRGLPVGTAVKGLDGKWRVVLVSDRAPIDFVRILLFKDFTQLVNVKELDVMPVPPATPGTPATNVAPQTATLQTAAAKAAATATPGATAPAATTPAPAAAKSPTAKPEAAKPAAAKSVATTAATPKPAVTKPAVAKPATPKATTTTTTTTATKPAAPKLAAAKPAAAKPAAAKPAATKPAAPKPASARPATTKSATGATAHKPAEPTEEPPH
jgi:rod shape-determining protein MreC